MKKLIVMILAVSLLLCACGGSGEVSQAPAVDLDVAAVGGDMAKATGFDAIAWDNADILNKTGIKEDKYTEVYFAWLLEATVGNCACVAVFEATDKSAASEISDLLKVYLADEQERQKEYNADNYEMAKKGVVETDGNYVYMIIAPDTDGVKAVYENAKSGN